MSSPSVNGSHFTPYSAAVNQSEQVCSPEPVCSAPPEESVCQPPEDSASVSTVPEGKAQQSVSLVGEEFTSKIPAQMSVDRYSEAGQVCKDPVKPRTFSSDIEADVKVDVKDNKIKASGKVKVKQQFIQNIFTDAFKENNQISNARVSFDKDHKTYTVSGTYKIDYFPDQDFAITFKPVLENNKLGIKIHNTEYFGPQNSVFDNYIGEKIAENLTRNDLRSAYNPGSKAILLDTDAILRKTDAVPHEMRVDLTRNNISLSESAKGNLTLRLNDPSVNDPVNLTPYSDVQISFDKTSVQSLLQKTFGTDLEIKTLELRDGEIEVKGKASSEDLKDLNVGIAGVAFLLGMNPSFEVGRAPRVDTTLNIKFSGKNIIIRPEQKSHVEPFVEAIKKQGYTVASTKEELSIPADELLPEEGKGSLNSVKIDQNGVNLEGVF